MFVISAIQTLTFVLVGNAILGIQGMNMAYWLVLFTTACFANMMGLNISASFNSAVTIYILIPFLVIPQLLLSGVIVKFDKLNPVVTNPTHVPLVGEVMASRWAYEALAVYQFKENAFESQFYELDKDLKQAEFRKNFWLSKLKEKISGVENNLGKEEKKEYIDEALLLLRNEITKELANNPKVAFDELNNLYPEKIDIKTIRATNFYLNSLNEHYLTKFKQANKEKDALATKLNADSVSKALFIDMKNNYTNDALSDFVKNKNELNRILEFEGNLYQKIDPIYLEPNSFRAHFYAPVKKVFGVSIDTFWFNIIIIWLMSVLLIITLYFDVLKYLINATGKLADKISKKDPKY